MKSLYIFSILFFCSFNAFAQNTVGLIQYDVSKAFEGYNLHFPHNQGSVYLLNNCGEIVHSWPDNTGYKPGNGVWLRDNGWLYVAKGRGGVSNPNLHAGGGGEKIEIRDWDNSILWSYTMNDSLQRLHHDISIMPNGNILAIAWEKKSMAEAIAAGRDTSKLTEGELWPDKIVEIQPSFGTGLATIVWEWHAWDHLIQDFDSSKTNYGVVANNPHKIDLNYTAYNTNADWMHSNAIDYNESLDQIVLSVPTFNEVWIIDHSTTTAQATTSNGGLAGRGGDLLYRWGNPAAYQVVGTQQLFYQHDIHWADKGLDNSHPEYGKLVVFNNQVGVDYSSAHTFSPIFDSYNWEYSISGNSWGPTNFDWNFSTTPPQDMYSTGLSSVQILPNSNRLICIGRWGRSIEVTDSGDVVWEYINPIKAGNPLPQGDTSLTINANLQFRMTRYASDYAAFNGKTLNPMGYIELNPDTNYCATLVNIEPLESLEEHISIFPNPNQGQFQLKIDLEETKNRQIRVLNSLGQVIWQKESRENQISIDLDQAPAGFYFLKINGRTAAKIIKQ